MKLGTASQRQISKVQFRHHWWSAAFILLLICYSFAPVAALFNLSTSVIPSDIKQWLFVRDDLVPDLVFNTLILCVGTLFLSLLLGIGSAISLEHLPKRSQRFFEVLLTLPMAMPIYLYSFIYVGVFEWSAPLPTLVRTLTGGAVNSLNVKNLGGATIVFALALYPYILIPLRLSLRGRSGNMLKCARLLGRSRARAWWDILRAAGQRAILMGMIVIAMECLSEFGAVSMLGVETFTTAIYTAWSSFYSLEIAARLGLMLLVFIVPLIGLEHVLTNRKRSELLQESSHSERSHPSLRALFFIAVTVVLSLGIPLFQLLLWLFEQERDLWTGQLLSLFLMTCALALACGVFAVCLSFALTYISRFHQGTWLDVVNSKLKSFYFYGYALPGNLLAIAFLGVGAVLLGRYSYAGAIGLLVCALSFKFLRVSYKKCEVGNDLVTDDMVKSGLLWQEGKPSKFLRLIYLPMLKPYLGYGVLFMMIEVVKELPLTMILRPMGVNTLSTKLFELTSEGEWESAAPYALVLILLCICFHYVVVRLSTHDK